MDEYIEEQMNYIIKSMKSVVKSIANPEGVKESRKDVFTDEFNDIIVDTCKAFDTGIWETGVHRNSKWTITEQYSSRDLAEAGHKEYVKVLKENPDTQLPDIQKNGSFDFNDDDDCNCNCNCEDSECEECRGDSDE